MQGIAYWIEKRAYITPDRTALTGEHRRLSYKEMAVEIEQVASILNERFQIKTGDRVAILSGNSIEYLILLFAIAKLGSIAVPLNIRLGVPELEFQIADSQAEVLITCEDFSETGNKLQKKLELKGVLSFKELWSLAGSMHTKVSYASLLAPPYSANGEMPFIICYTSGTTGRPKGAVLTQANMFWNALNNSFAIDITSKDKVLTVLPLFHIGGIGLFALPALLAGGAVIVPDRFDPAQALQMIEQEQATIIMGVPTIHDALRKSDRFPETNLESVRWFYSGGAPCPHELIRFYLERGIRFGQGYGMTETSPTVFMLSEEDHRNKVGSIGKPAIFCDIRVVDAKGRDVAIGEVGELLVKGPNVIKEYWNLPMQTADSFSSGWLHTGDLVRMDNEGFVYIAGRKKEMIISGGENIYPLEVEQVLGQLPAVEEAAVVGFPDEKWGEVPIAIVSLKQGHSLTARELAEYCAGRLARYKVPKHVYIIEALPKNATGKIDRALLKNQYAKIS